jgi:hypothetical protein
VNLLIFTTVVVGLTTGGSSSSSTPTPARPAPTSPTPSSAPTTPSSAPTPTPSPTIAAEKGSVLWVALHLEIATPTPSGYSRHEFGQKWADVDRNECDQRNDVLRRDTNKRHTKPGTDGLRAPERSDQERPLLLRLAPG